MYQNVLEEMLETARRCTAEGEPADYIPELSFADSSKLGISIVNMEGMQAEAGDSEFRFTIQSIVKVFAFTCALQDSGLEKVLEKVSLEPTGDSFNSIISLETKNFNKPLNPMINAGAIACLTQVQAEAGSRTERILNFCRRLTGNEELQINEAVYKSELETGSRNRAMAYFMKSTNIIDGDVEALLDDYFKVCAIEMSCSDLAAIALIYANNGVHPATGEQLFSAEIARVSKAVMVMCGMYDEAGEVAAKIGLPCKSGVGGGIMAVVPGRMGIGIYGPALNKKGTSIAGLKLLELFSNAYNLSIF